MRTMWLNAFAVFSIHFLIFELNWSYKLKRIFSGRFLDLLRKIFYHKVQIEHRAIEIVISQHITFSFIKKNP